MILIDWLVASGALDANTFLRLITVYNVFYPFGFLFGANCLLLYFLFFRVD